MNERPTIHENEPRDISVCYIAGAFEAGGGMGYRTYKGKNGTPLAYPYVQLSDKHPSGVSLMHTVFGGCLIPKKNGSYNWYVQGDQVRPVVTALTDQSLAINLRRQDILESFERWLAADNPTDRYQIALKNSQFQSPITPPDQYRNLVHNPGFLAGIMDFRTGLFMATNPNGNQSPRLSFASTNTPLLKSLYEVYGGWLNIDTTSLVVSKLSVINQMLTASWPHLVNYEKFMPSSSVEIEEL